MGLRRYQSSGATKFVLYHPHFVQVKAAAQQGECRIAKEIFRYREVFNTSVDKFVENSRPDMANFSLFNVLGLFAQYLCN